MTYSKAYEQGFCKTAADAGVDPAVLVKVAKDDGILSAIVNSYKSLDPSTKRAILGGLISGIGTYTLSDGNNRAMKGLAGGLAGGAATYGLDRMGLFNKSIFK